MGDISESWSEDICLVLENIRINSVTFSQFHKNRYFFYKSLIKYFRLPSIILSAVGSVSAVGLQAYIEQQHISAITCGLSLVVGVINSIELFLKINETIESELSNSKDFYTLAIDIKKTLDLDAVNRGVMGSKYLDAKYSTFTKLVENGNLINNKVLDVLTKIPKKEQIKQMQEIQHFSNKFCDDSYSLSSDDSPKQEGEEYIFTSFIKSFFKKKKKIPRKMDRKASLPTTPKGKNKLLKRNNEFKNFHNFKKDNEISESNESNESNEISESNEITESNEIEESNESNEIVESNKIEQSNKKESDLESQL